MLHPIILSLLLTVGEESLPLLCLPVMQAAVWTHLSQYQLSNPPYTPLCIAVGALLYALPEMSSPSKNYVELPVGVLCLGYPLQKGMSVTGIKLMMKGRLRLGF